MTIPLTPTHGYNCPISTIGAERTKKRTVISANDADQQSRRDAFVAFCTAHNMPLPKGDWRMTKQRTGEITGLVLSRGTLVATNGIDCFIGRGDGSIYFGHVGTFVPDRKKHESSGGRKSVSSPKEFDLAGYE